MRILGDYELASGQKINRSKCSVSFDSATIVEVRRSVGTILGMREVSDQRKFLGLPSKIGRSKREVFNFLSGRLEDRLRGWKGKVLSHAGKEVMIKSVTSAIPICVMNYFKLTFVIIDNLNSSMAKFY
ncbi:hypothetical protein LIER_31633 [Lithospermum erythrorhizon]|uniref:Uncharacterized protein n=1 Tax=Lithospermum erythrorhizon TaxID=34254 RepID=A0AAV3RTZ5_LITER